MSRSVGFEEFVSAPTQKAKGHAVYRRDWFFALRTMPESAYGEMLLGSLHRRLGLAVASETEVASLGTELANRLDQKSRPPGALLEPREFRAVLAGVLDFPRTASQSGKRALTVLPLVPEMANYAAPVRLRGSPWNPGSLISELVIAGSVDAAHADKTWVELYESLDVNPTDDVWARFLVREVAAWRTRKLKQLVESRSDRPGPTPLVRAPSAELHLGSFPALRAPATQFVADLEALIELRTRLTRRSWLAYLESLLRLAAVTHTQWLCRVHDIVWREVSDALVTGAVPSHPDVVERLERALRQPWWSLGDLFSAKSRTLVQGYQRARYGLNLVLFAMDDDGTRDPRTLPRPAGLNGLADLVHELATWASEYPDALRLREQLVELLEEDPRVSDCRKGFTNNLREFWLYSLAKRQPALPRDAEFDQSYWLQKRSSSRSAPWIAMPGPAALSLAVHSCVRRAGGFGTVGDLAEYFASYGLGTRQPDFESGPLAERLRGLGLVVDSPDAEAGMGLVDPLGDD